MKQTSKNKELCKIEFISIKAKYIKVLSDYVDCILDSVSYDELDNFDAVVLMDYYTFCSSKKIAFYLAKYFSREGIYSKELEYLEYLYDNIDSLDADEIRFIGEEFKKYDNAMYAQTCFSALDALTGH